MAMWQHEVSQVGNSKKNNSSQLSSSCIGRRAFLQNLAEALALCCTVQGVTARLVELTTYPRPVNRPLSRLNTLCFVPRVDVSRELGLVGLRA